MHHGIHDICLAYIIENYIVAFFMYNVCYRYMVCMMYTEYMCQTCVYMIFIM
jgi:hypothetical protein